MSCTPLLRFANDQRNFPIHINVIVDWICKNSFQDEIEFIQVEMDSKKLLGIFRQYTHRSVLYGDPKLITQIIYPKNIPAPMERLVVCKELLHIFDTDKERVSTPHSLDDLINGIVLRKLGDGSSEEAVRNDLYGPFLAMAVLIPPEARRKFKQACIDGRTTAAEIATYVNLPLNYVEAWISPTTDDLLRTLLERYNLLDLL